MLSRAGALLTQRSPFRSPARLRALSRLLPALLGATLFGAEPTTAVEVKRASLQGNLDGDRARLVIEADLGSLGPSRAKAIYGAALEQLIRVSRDRLDHTIGLQVEALEGGLREIVLTLGGTGEVRQVTGDGLEDWSVRQAGDRRFLVLRLAKSDTPVKTFAGQVRAETLLTDWPVTVTPLTLTTESATLAHGFVRIASPPEWSVQLANPSGVVPVELPYLPPSLRPADLDTTAEPLALRFHGTAYSIPLALALADPEARQVTLRDFHLTGRLEDQRATFQLRATARVKNPHGGRLELLRGGVALSQLPPLAGGRLRFEKDAFVLDYDAPGDFPLDLEFHATVRPADGWQEVDFGVAPSALQPVVFPDLPADTEFRFAGAARPELEATGFRSFLPPTGQVKLAWKAGRPEAEGRLFYAVEGLSQVTVSPGLLRQTTVLDFKVMQGELNRVACRLKGEGEVTRVQGPSVLSWTLEPPLADGTRRLVIQLNAAQRDQFSLALQLQRTLGAFPRPSMPRSSCPRKPRASAASFASPTKAPSASRSSTPPACPRSRPNKSRRPTPPVPCSPPSPPRPLPTASRVRITSCAFRPTTSCPSSPSRRSSPITWAKPNSPSRPSSNSTSAKPPCGKSCSTFRPASPWPASTPRDPVTTSSSMFPAPRKPSSASSMPSP
ncbi:MAG: hypothetical protein M5U12_24865 [Verrucomicrobia bacterium]|nr:hypothetical protein [Verrucomicrobiota bacterium]